MEKKCWICKRTKKQWIEGILKENRKETNSKWSKGIFAEVGWVDKDYFICPICKQLIWNVGVDMFDTQLEISSELMENIKGEIASAIYDGLTKKESE